MDKEAIAKALKDGAISTAQGASNAVAGNVTTPIDIITMLLRKNGINVPENSVGSTEWAKQMGLIVDPKNKLMGQIGEGLGGTIAPLAFMKHGLK